MRINDAIRIAVNCAKKYENELRNRNLLFLFQDKGCRINGIELIFRAQHFMHLTGLKAKNKQHPISAPDFYKKCLDKRLQENEVTFSEDGTTELKLSILPNIICKNLMANSIGDFNGSTIKLMTDKIVGNQHAFIGSIFIQEFGYFIPNTFVKGDIRDYTKNRRRIIAIFRKKQMDAVYEEITYIAKKVDWNEVVFPEKYSVQYEIIKNEVNNKF